MPSHLVHCFLRWLPHPLARWTSRRGRRMTPAEREQAKRWSRVRGMTLDESYRVFVLHEPVEEVMANPRVEVPVKD